MTETVNARGHGADLVVIRKLLQGDQPISGGKKQRIGSQEQPCCYCNKRVSWTFKSGAFEATTDCAYAGLAPLDLEVFFPNSFVAIGEDFRLSFSRAPVAEIMGRPTEPMFGSATLAEQVEASRCLAEAGCAFGYIDASRPALYHHGNDLIVAEVPDDLRAQLEWKKIAALPHRDKPLRSFSLCGQTRLLDRMAPVECPREYVNVGAGTYRFRSYQYMRNFDPSSGVAIYARFTWLREGK